ncbi:MAG: tetratricopeptide repeat protein [Prevotellaceae bacterium]|jgi:tetratricopeptide (TPR) repeat protein|nr:tetratricopeptide repeat protein [Prevotellaceae bacterium]
MGTINSVKLDESNNNIIIQEVREGATVNVYQIKIDEFPIVAEYKERIEELKKLLARTDDLYDRDRLAWGQEKADLEKKVADTETTIQEIIKSYDINSSPLYKKAFELLMNGNLDDALAKLNEAKLDENEKKLKAAEAKLEADKKNTAAVRILKAQMLELKYDFENAEANYLKSLSIFPSLENNFKIAYFYYKLNEFKKAEIYYVNCLVLVETEGEKAAVLHNLGPLQHKIKNYSQAKDSYLEALKIYRNLADVNPKAYLPDVAGMLNNLGVLQNDIKDYPQAESCYQDALKIWRELAAANPQACLPDLAMTLINLGVLQNDMNEYSKAEAYYKEALRIYRNLAAVNPQTFLHYVAIMFNNLGILQSDINDYKKAKAYYKKALKIKRELAIVNPQAYLPDLAMTLNNLGSLQHKIKKNSQAKASYLEALKIYRNLVDSNPQSFLHDMVKTLTNLAIFYLQSMPNKELSVQYAKEVLSYRSSLEHIPAAHGCIKDAEAVLERWQSH